MAIKIPVQHSQIRKLDVRRDLLSVAQLVEICFFDQMDSEGFEYIRQIRRAAQDSRFIRWVPGARERVSYPLHGYVWEENGRIIGNLSLIPFLKDGAWRYLIANVAVHPEYRRHGIARKLTEQALEHIQDRGVSAAWLQVREDNTAAYNLYQSIGFEERARRATWQTSADHITKAPATSSIKVTSRWGEDWRQQEAWLHAVYPPEVTWNLPLQISHLRPGFTNWLAQTFSGRAVRHWAARRTGQLIGVVSWEQTWQYIDNLWVASEPGCEEEALPALLHKLRQALPFRHRLAINYPAGRAQEALMSSGFHLHNTLVWMAVEFDQKHLNNGQGPAQKTSGGVNQ